MRSLDEIPERHILVDFKNTLWKSWKAVPSGADDLARSSDGYPTGHIFRFARTLAKWKSLFGGDLVIFYEGGEKKRYEMFPDYKAGRKRDDFDPIPDAMQLLKNVACTEIRPVDAEADDGIAAWVRRFPDVTKLILSSDKDLWQLRSPSTQIMSFKEILTEGYIRKSCKKHYGTETPKDITLAKALYGDKSDNLPSVPRLFRKHMAPLLEKAGDVDELLSYVDELPKNTKAKILDHEEQIRKVYTAVQLRSEVKLKRRVRKGDPKALEEFLKKYECHSLLDRVPLLAG